MQMRAKRRMRTRPRLWTIATSIPCVPYTVSIMGMDFPMGTKRVKFSFYMQYADHQDCMRKIKQVVEAEQYNAERSQQPKEQSNA